jgi:hypothetical protein
MSKFYEAHNNGGRPIAYVQSAIDIRPKPNWVKPFGARTHFDVLQDYINPHIEEKKHY